jgi:hypothetical protein
MNVKLVPIEHANAIRVVCMQPIPLHLYNVIRKALYMHVPVWAFDHVDVKVNPIHNAIPSELIENKLKQLIITSEAPNRVNAYKICATVKPVNAIMRGSDIVFKPSMYASIDPIREFGIRVDPNVEIIAMLKKTENVAFEIALDGKFGTAFQNNDQCVRYSVYNVSIEEENEDANTVSSFVYMGRGHYAQGDCLFYLAMQSIQDMIHELEVGFLECTH